MPRPAELALSAGVFVLGAAAALVTAGLPGEGGYAGIGPNFFPAVVAAGLLALGAWLGFEALSGGWRRRVAPPGGFHAPSFVWVSLGLFAHMALIGWAGFVPAGSALFGGVARGFGSRRPVRDLLIGFFLSLALFLFFVELLNVSLPAGWMRFLL